MGPFHHPIQLGMVCSRGVDAGAHGLQGAGEGAAGELQSSVRDNLGQNSEAADPVGEEGVGDGVGIDGGEGDGLEPPGQPLADGQQVALALALGERTTISMWTVLKRHAGVGSCPGGRWSFFGVFTRWHE